MKRNSTDYFLVRDFLNKPVIFTAIILFLVSCSTTTIQTGGNQYKPNDFEQRAPEERFFNEMSKQDPALQDRKEVKAKDVAVKDESSAKTDNITTQRDARLDQYNDTRKQPVEVVDYNKEAVPEETAKKVAVVENDGFNLTGTASWYGRDFDGKPTASGVIYDSRKLTAAHKKIPLGSIALVKNTENGKEILVTINDRGPFVGDRILDVSEYGAELLGYKEQGLTQVEMKIVRMGKGKGSKKKGATFNFFGNDSDTKDVGAGDDRQANQEIDSMLDQEEKHNRNTPITTIQPESTQKGYAVQVGIFSDLRNAKKLKKYLESSTRYEDTVYIFSRNHKFTVKMGSFKQKEDADSLKGRLISEGYHAFISK